MSGSVIAIFVAPASRDRPAAQSVAQLDAGRGIVGDRYYDKDPDAQITLVDADTIDAVNAATGWSLRAEETRRNVVTRGVDLNQWEHGRLRVGDAIVEGVELCEPCAILGGLLANDSRQRADVVKALLHKAGLRARIVEGAEIRPGDRVEDASAAGLSAARLTVT